MTSGVALARRATRGRQYGDRRQRTSAREPFEPLFAALQAMNIEVGDNQPYDGRFAMGYTLEHHAIGRGLPHAMIELRNNEIADPGRQQRWATQLADALITAGMIAKS